jgi:single-strand DNA-binding protein
MYQKIFIMGNLGRDPEMRYMPDGTAVTNFNVAVNYSYTDPRSGQQIDETTWFRVSAWGRQAETANQYLSKGRQVFVEGRLLSDPATGGPRTFTRQDGTVGASFEIRASAIKFIGGRDGVAGGYDDGDSFSGGAPVQEEDDIPF